MNLEKKRNLYQEKERMCTCKNNVCVPGKRTDCVPEEITDVNLEKKKHECVPGERMDVYLEKE